MEDIRSMIWLGVAVLHDWYRGKALEETENGTVNGPWSKREARISRMSNRECYDNGRETTICDMVDVINIYWPIARKEGYSFDVFGM